MIHKSENDIINNWNSNIDPVVSIICPTYNHENYIEQALDSFLMQETNFPFEIIIHDDASTDNTVNKINAYTEKYPHIIKTILQEENQYSQGGQRIFFFLSEKAKGKYHALCEGDDYWIDSKKLQLQIDLMEQYPQCHMSFHPAEKRFENDADGKIYANQAYENKIFSVSDVILGGGGFCPSASLIYRKEVVSDLPKFFSKAPVGDYFLQILGSLNGGALYINKVMAVYRQGVAVSWQSSMQNIDRRIKFYQKMIKSLDELDVYCNHRYHDEIAHEKSKQMYDMAVFYLYNNMVNEFNKHMELSHQTYPLKSFYYFMDYHLKSFPGLIKKLKKLKLKIKV
ncbi:glycosyltransferase [Sulfurovum sp. TSL1]|uniref:glycosyltransferase family 2 protein n=1 Tax=Sulfurovum sp. TSL1 TaxID=2826994 RepID=UPI001CC6F480|nr:glycosyltransferase [Sulfurovum sp. TSL1]GIT98074.1 glycosyl transferase [Sulfurovum sp. TSL1]